MTALESLRFEHLCGRCNQFLRRERFTEDVVRVHFAGGTNERTNDWPEGKATPKEGQRY